MALPNQLGDKEVQKFAEDADGKVSIRTEGIVKGAEGNKASVGEDGRLSTQDDPALETQVHIRNLLQDILHQLKIITGEDR